MNLSSVFLFLIVLFIIEILYFKIADYFHIIDKPNNRSSHTVVTIRGGGIVFGLAAIIFYFAYHFQYPYFITGVFLIALISFLDDVITLNNRIRLSIHFISVGMLLYELDLFIIPWYYILVIIIFVIGTINAYNFMDGINGLTGGYSLLTISTLYYIQKHVTEFTNTDFLVLTGLALLVFNFFNFRNKAKAFAGDVGSISIAFIIIFFLSQLIIKTMNLGYLLLLLVYGLDSASTIIFRLTKRENIFKAHRSHFYQYWTNERKVPHLTVSTYYIIVQLVINVLLLSFFSTSMLLNCLLLFFCIVIFIVIRFYVQGSRNLLGR